MTTQTKTFPIRTFRAAYWIAADRQSSVLLTKPEQAGLTNDDLIADARRVFGEQGGIIGDGEIVVGTWRE